MTEKLLLKLATLLIEKLVGWITKKLHQRKVNRREHERIHNAARELHEATSNADINDAFGRMP